jgi:hypothetical protein
LIPKIVTVTSFPIIKDSVTRRVRISIYTSLAFRSGRAS